MKITVGNHPCWISCLYSRERTRVVLTKLAVQGFKKSGLSVAALLTHPIQKIHQVSLNELDMECINSNAN